jgi:cell division septation protein DedD
MGEDSGPFRGEQGIMKRILIAAAVVAACALSAPAAADTKTGVDAWNQGDYVQAVAIWRPLAEAGDVDAQFNLGQAYKSGKGVPADDTIALEWFRRAAAQGHAQAEDNYGRLLFQIGRRQEAMPYIRKSAERGDARAQYLLGTAMFNGEYVPKDWVRAYALMTRSAASGLGPAQASLSQMDRYIPADERQQGQALAKDMETTEKAAALAATQLPLKPEPKRDTPKPIRTAEVPPSAPPVVTAAAAPAPVKTPAPRKPKPATEPVPAPVPAAVAASGPWRVQLGAFSAESGANAQWKSVSAKVGALAGKQRYLLKAGSVTRLLAGPLASQADAEKLCKAVKASGADCLIKKM